MKKSIIIASVLLLMAIGGYFLFFRSGAKKYDFRFDKVSIGDVTMYVTATGTINAVTSVDVERKYRELFPSCMPTLIPLLRKGKSLPCSIQHSLFNR